MPIGYDRATTNRKTAMDRPDAAHHAAVDGLHRGRLGPDFVVCDFVVATDRSDGGMPEIDWDITPGWGGVTRLADFRTAKGEGMEPDRQLFDAATAERHDLINRICKPADLDVGGDKLVQ